MFEEVIGLGGDNVEDIQVTPPVKPVTRAHRKELAKSAEAAKSNVIVAEGRQRVIVFKRGTKKVGLSYKIRFFLAVINEYIAIIGVFFQG